MKKTLCLVGLFCLVASSASAALLITEVFYDHTSTDNQFEWVEITNTGPTALDLSNYMLAWGGTDYTYGTLFLSGQLDACATAVIGGPTSDAENGNPVYFMATDLNPDLQNAGTASDAVALFSSMADVSVETPLDAVIYDFPNSNGLIDNTGTVPATEMVGDAPAGSSIERTSVAGDWVIQGTPDPNNVSFNFDCGGVVPDEADSWGAIKSLYR